MQKTLIAVTLSLFAVCVSAAMNPGVQFSSGVQRVAVVELYTSEGCSSCPPADRWLSSLKSDAGLWNEFIPVALHVDYWDYIGWEDRFASPEFSQRQRNYVRAGAAHVSYTPGVFLSGAEWLGWRQGRSAAGDRQDVGELTLALDGTDLTASFSPTDAGSDSLELTVAVLGMQLETRVRAGENKGRTLYHDFVALDVRTLRLRKHDGKFTATMQLDGIDADANQLALAAWVSSQRDQSPIQATGGYLP